MHLLTLNTCVLVLCLCCMATGHSKYSRKAYAIEEKEGVGSHDTRSEHQEVMKLLNKVNAQASRITQKVNQLLSANSNRKIKLREFGFISPEQGPMNVVTNAIAHTKDTRHTKKNYAKYYKRNSKRTSNSQKKYLSKPLISTGVTKTRRRKKTHQTMDDMIAVEPPMKSLLGRKLQNTRQSKRNHSADKDVSEKKHKNNRHWKNTDQLKDDMIAVDPMESVGRTWQNPRMIKRNNVKHSVDKDVSQKKHKSNRRLTKARLWKKIHQRVDDMVAVDPPMMSVGRNWQNTHPSKRKHAENSAYKDVSEKKYKKNRRLTKARSWKKTHKPVDDMMAVDPPMKSKGRKWKNPRPNKRNRVPSVKEVWQKERTKKPPSSKGIGLSFQKKHYVKSSVGQAKSREVMVDPPMKYPLVEEYAPESSAPTRHGRTYNSWSST